MRVSQRYKLTLAHADLDSSTSMLRDFCRDRIDRPGKVQNFRMREELVERLGLGEAAGVRTA